MARKIRTQCAIGGEAEPPPTRPTPVPGQTEFQLVRTLVNCLYYHLNKDDSVEIPQKKTTTDLRRVLSIYSRLDRDQYRQPSTLFIQSVRDFILYSVAYLCYSNGIEDTKLVSWLLIHMHKTYGQFMFLFQASFPHPTKDFIWGGVLNYRNTSLSTSNSSKRCHPFAYFVHHAVKARLQFRRVRFLDLRLTHPNEFRPCPVYLASSLGEVDLLKYLLSMGANLGQDSFQSQMQLIKPPWVFALIVKLLSNALRNGILSIMSTVIENERDNTALKKVRNGENEIECLRLLLRAVPPLNLRWFDYRQNAFWRQFYVSAQEMIIHMSEDLLPKLKHRFLEPTELKHYCRISIREALRKNWQMPDGIFALEIPTSLKQYLNLEDD